MPRFVHFEIHADDPQRALSFYRDVLGWSFEQWNGPNEYWMATTGGREEPGINGAIIPRHLGQATVNTVEVSDIDAFVTKVTEHGGKLVGQINEIPNVGRGAYFTDTEGNVFGAIEFLKECEE